MDPFSIDLGQITCGLSNQAIDTYAGYTPYLFASSEDRTIWYDCNILLEKTPGTLKKVHLFVVLRSGTFFVGNVDCRHLNPLYLKASREAFKRNHEAALTALFYHHKAQNQVFNQVKNDADINLDLSFLVGQVLLKSENISERPKGINLLVTSAEQGKNLKAAYIAGQALLKGIGIAEETAKKQAIILLEKVPEDQFDTETGLSFAKLCLMSERYEKGKSLFYTYAKKGDPIACYEYALLLFQEGNEKESFQWYLKAADAEKPHPLAAFEAAMILHKQKEFCLELKRRLFLQAAASGNKEAAFQAGMMCKDGVGADVDLELSKSLFLESVKERGGEAYYQIGLICQKSKNDSVGMANDYFNKAVALGFQKARECLVAEDNVSGKSNSYELESLRSSKNSSLRTTSSSESLGSSFRKKSISELVQSSRRASKSNGEDDKITILQGMPITNLSVSYDQLTAPKKQDE